METVGEVSEVEGESVIEWKINDFFSLCAKFNSEYSSPPFSFADALWYLTVFPNGLTSVLSRNGGRKNTKGYIDVYLYRSSSGPPINVEFFLGLKTVEGKIDLETYRTHDYEKLNYGIGCSLLKRSELLKKKFELTSCNAITVVCRLKFPKLIGVVSNATVQKCSYCKMTLQANEDVSFHQEKCIDKPMKCPDCSEVIALKDWYPHNCQQSVTEVSEKLFHDFKAMMLNGNNSDTIIKVKGEEFRLHKDILSFRNTFFDSMFKTDMKEKTTGIVSIEDCDPGIFRSFIHFLYTGRVDKLSPDSVCDLYEIADKYQEDQLKKLCLRYMMNIKSVDNFCDYIILALRHDEKGLLQKVTDYFYSKSKEIVRSVKWQIFVAEYPTQANELFIKTLDHLVK